MTESYDNIGLLRPARGENGYRRYGEAHVAQLQQILFFRESGLDLAQIAEILQDENFDAAPAMEQHIRSLQARRHKLEALIETSQRTLKAMRGEASMTDKEKFEGFKKELIQKTRRTTARRFGSGGATRPQTPPKPK